jgi:DNA-binding XRE family transcriptional regulator
VELAQILGVLSEVPVSHHERSAALPSLLTAISYEIVFRTAVSEMFPGLYHAVETGIEERIGIMEEKLKQSTIKGRRAAPIAQKLEFFCERKD